MTAVRRSTLLGGLLIASLLLAACGENAGEDLQGKTWHLGAMSDTSPDVLVAVPAEHQALYTLTFNADHTFAARADCNRVAGAWATPRRDSLTITPGPSTMGYCGSASYSDMYIHLLSRAESYVVDREQLTISLTRGGRLTFVVGPTPSPGASAEASASVEPSAAATKEPTPKPTKEPTPKPTKEPTPKPTKEPTPKPTAGPTEGPTEAPTASPAPSNGLLDKTWLLSTFDLITPPFVGTVPPELQASFTVTFADDGTFSAQADCNIVNGTYVTTDPTADEGDLVLTPVPTTTVACPGGSLGDLFVIGLVRIQSYVITDDVMTATQGDGGAVTFR